jgi:hypothetical protein
MGNISSHVDLTSVRREHQANQRGHTEEKLVFMKNDVNRIQAVLRAKLGVALD